MGVAGAGLTFAAAMRVIHRVHHHAPHVRPPTLPTHTAGFAYRCVFVIRIADLPDGRLACSQYSSHFSGLQPNLHVSAFSTHDLSRASGASDKLASLTRTEFDIMNHRSRRHAGQWQCIARSNLRIRA